MTGFTRFDYKDLRKERDIVYWNKAKLAITCAIDRRTNATNRPTGTASYKRDLAHVKRKIPFCLHVAKRCLAKFRPWRVRILGLSRIKNRYKANHHHSSILLLVFVLNFLYRAVFNGPSICPSIHPPVRPQVRPSVQKVRKRAVWLLSTHPCLAMDFRAFWDSLSLDFCLVSKLVSKLE